MCPGCLPLLIQLLHGCGPGTDGLFGSMRGCTAARVRAAQALRNIVTSNPDGRRSSREERVLQLLEQVRLYCDALTTDADTEEEASQRQDHDRAAGPHGESVSVALWECWFSAAGPRPCRGTTR